MHAATPQDRTIGRAGFTIATHKAPILSASELETASARLFSYTFNSLAALAEVDPTGEDGLQVAHAGEWARSRKLGEGDGVKVVQKWDWTYTTTHPGTFEPVASTSKLAFEAAPSSHPGIPLKRLASQDEPILFFDEVTLFEDELHDCGMANLTVKVRVMPSFLFILSRFFLRVDHVLFRIFDVRIYHAFSSKEVLREIRGREATYEDVKRRLQPDQPDDLTPLTDSNWVASTIGMLEDTRPASASAAPPEPTSIRSYLAQQSTAPSRTAPTALPTRSAARTNADENVEEAAPAPRKPWKGVGTRLEVLKLS